MKSPLRAPAVLVVVTSVGTEQQALDIAHHLVESRLAACVNILPGVRSVFRWKGKVQHEGEFLLLAKTVPGNFERVRAVMKELNAYELPEIVGFPADQVDPAFAKWVAESSTGIPNSSDDGEDEPGEVTID
ncbi:MAG TPA: divalent-cation tolerance protein CutA [Thermoanaerobaculia bacterium]